MNMPAERPTKVLVAEDDYLVAQLIVRTLKTIGYTDTIEASSGSEAVEMTIANRPDVILMDIQMPGMDGLEATRLIQGLRPTPVVILSAHDSADLVQKASRAGAGAYVTKPPDPAALDRSIAIAVARHGDLMAYRRLVEDLETKTHQLENALAEIKTLRGILPMCMFCKKVRDDEGYWHRVEEYIQSNSEAVVTHGLCAGCMKEHYPEQA